MSASVRLWQVLEELPTLAAVLAEWRRVLDGELDHIRPFLRPQPRPATSFPRPGDGHGEACRVVCHGPDDIVAVCPETGARFPLTREDLVVCELDQRRLASSVAGALGIKRGGGEPCPWGNRAWRLGRLVFQHGSRRTTFLIFPHEPNDLHAAATGLIASRQAPFLLLAPTRRWLRPETDAALHANGSVFLPLDEILVADQARRFHLIEPVTALVARLGVVLGGSISQSRRGIAVKQPRTPRKRATRAANIELLERALEEHYRAARDYAWTTKESTGEPALLPRPERQELAKQTGMGKWAVSRCLKDPRAKYLRILWDGALELDRVMQWKDARRRKTSG